MAATVPKEPSLLSFEKSLENLTFNSKPLIDDLTRTAGQLEHEGKRVVEIIEARIQKVHPQWKLPSLYLMDSILKNLKGVYLDHVGQVIVGTFRHCFEKLTDSDPRKSLYKLRTTWPPYLSKQKLAAIDKDVHALDPNWPIVAVDEDPPAATIFVNPDFVEKQPTSTTTTSIQDRRKVLLQQAKNWRQKQEREMGLSVPKNTSDEDRITGVLESHSRSVSPLPNVQSNPNHTSKHADSNIHQEEAPPAVKKVKVEEKSSKEEGECIKQSHLQLDDLPPELLPVHYENMLKKIQRLIDAGNLTPEQRSTLMKQLDQLYELQKLKSEQSGTKSATPPCTQPPSTYQFTSQEHSDKPPLPIQHPKSTHSRGHGSYRYQGFKHHRPLHRSKDVVPVPGDLFNNLVKAGMVEDFKIPMVEDFKIPNLSLTPATLKQHYPPVITLLHVGEPCSSCGLRFSSSSGDHYRSHLNWHYKINRQEKEGHSRSRNWFMHPDDWLKYEELGEELDGNRLHLELTREESPVKLEKSTENEAAVSCSVEAGDVNEVCSACNEQFEQFWDEDEAAWHFKDALRDRNGKLYHTFCFDQVGCSN